MKNIENGWTLNLFMISLIQQLSANNRPIVHQVSPSIQTLVHGIYLGALCAGALLKVPLKVLIWDILIKVPLIYYNLGHFG
jgi:hypothetical protein